MKSSDNTLVRMIALFKLLKATLLIAVGVGALKLLHKDLSSVLEHWFSMLGIDPGNRHVDSALQRVADLTPHKMKVLGIGSFIYAGLFLTEGIGLWLVKRWAEWFTVIVTGDRDIRDLPPSNSDQGRSADYQYCCGGIPCSSDSQRTLRLGLTTSRETTLFKATSFLDAIR